MKMALSIAVLALISDSAAHRHHHKLFKTHHTEIPASYPGVTFVQSDPIHGSLGPPKAKKENLTPEQQFE